LEAECLKDGKKERDMKRKDIEIRNSRLAKRNEHKTMVPLRCRKSWWNRQEALERKYQVARSELKLDESEKKKHKNIWNKYLTPQLTTNSKKLPTESGPPSVPDGLDMIVTKKTDNTVSQHRRRSYLMNNLKPVQPQVQQRENVKNKENNYTHTGSVGVAHSRNLDFFKLRPSCVFVRSTIGLEPRHRPRILMENFHNRRRLVQLLCF
jgi:hypothetical protein